MGIVSSHWYNYLGKRSAYIHTRFRFPFCGWWFLILFFDHFLFPLARKLYVVKYYKSKIYVTQMSPYYWLNSTKVVLCFRCMYKKLLQQRTKRLHSLDQTK